MRAGDDGPDAARSGGGGADVLHSRVTAAFLSHTSSFAILSVACTVTQSCSGRAVDRARRRGGNRVGAGVAIAAALAVALYYAHFRETYRTSSRASAARPPLRRPMPAAAGISPAVVGAALSVSYFGIPAAARRVGGVAVWRRSARTGSR